MYTLKSIARRSIALGMAVALFAATVMPTASVFADALNPLTDRSLTLSSGSPGWAFTDGSGNSTYAPPNSGANGNKTGNTFSFKVSTDTTATDDGLQAMTFQYCTTPAGNCMGPGNIPFVGTAGSYTRDTNNATQYANQKSDLQVVTSSPSEVSAFGSYVNATSGNVTAIPAASDIGNNFVVYKFNGTTWEQSSGWQMTATVDQTYGGAAGTVANGTSTNKANMITLTNTTEQGFTSGQQMKVVFFATDSNYITNPGADEFFVKINTYKDTAATELVDGGVTVANVMNESIHITTKVLETMDFSVGTVDPYTLEALEDEGGNEDETSQLYLASGQRKHGVCSPILKSMLPGDEQNRLELGDANGEFSLQTDKTYSTHSYWRLSSNSSAGASVYYSGVTLKNTVGDEIEAIGATAEYPSEGSEQFGLALATDSTSQPGELRVDYDVERVSGYVFENGADNAAAGLSTPLSAGIHASVTDADVSNLAVNQSWHQPRLDPLVPDAPYANGAGVNNTDESGPSTPVYGAGLTAQYAFDPVSNTIPVRLATQDDEVIDCATGKMRYIANIAATTPAGIYTTKINYIAAPQY